MNKRIIFILSALIAGAGTALWAMGDADQARRTAEEARDNTLVRATATVPPYQPQNFLRRQAVSRLMERQDTPDKIWYVYELAEGTGAVLGYYTASTPPIPYCTAMTQTEVREVGSNGAVALSAPSLDGTWGGADCDTRFFFDAVTDAIIMTQMKLRVLDQPLAGIDAPKLSVEVQQ